jgi:anti-sigma B factor antagonist
MGVGFFQVSERYEGGEALLSLAGELDLAGEGRLEEAIQHARNSGLPLTVDLSGLEFIDSSGLRVLVRLHNASERGGFDYTVIPGPPQVQRTFVLCGLDGTLPFAAVSAE